MSHERSDRASIGVFVSGLMRLDAGGLAVLRRSAGQTLAESSASYSTFFALLPADETNPTRQELFFLAATLYALATRHSDERPPAGSGLSLGLALRALRQERLNAAGLGSEEKISLDRRVAALVDTEAQQLPFRLRQIVRLVHSREQQINWHKLLDDLLHWSHPDRFVQRRWMREYYLGTSVEPLSGDRGPRTED